MATITTTTPPENLTGWTVTVPDGWSASSGYGLFSIDFDLPDAYDNTSLGIGYYFDFDDPSTLKPATNLVTAYSSIMTWSPNASFTFTVTGGLDVSNSSLIQWLADNKATFSKEEEGTQVDKTNNLPAFLKDLYQGIVKKKPDASKNPQNFRGEIESIADVPEWDGSFTKSVNNLTGTTWKIPSGWKTSADQGGFGIEGEFTIDNTTINITALHLGRYAVSGSSTYEANTITVVKAEDNSVHAIKSADNTSGFTLKITGGVDVTNTYLATWLGSDGQDTTKAIISFTIDGKTYRAEHHMTWEQWVASDCNTDNYAWYQEGSSYYLSKNGDTTVAVAYDGDYVESADTIVSRRAYVSIT